MSDETDPWWGSRVSYLRARGRVGWSRVKGAVVPNAQTAVLATIAWVLCRYLLNQPGPIFGAIACYLSLGFSRNRQPRRVLEIGLGATFGVLVGELVARYLGFGWWQLLLILLLTPLWARLVDGSDLMTFQSAINAMVVASMSLYALDPSHTGVGRWLDALVGVGVALLGAVLLPTSLTSRPRRYTATALAQLAEALTAIGEGLRRGEGERIKAAYGHMLVARDQLTQGRAAQESSADLAAINPSLRNQRAELAEIDRLLELGSRLHIAMTMLARQARAIVAESGPLPRPAALVDEVGSSLRHLSSAVSAFHKPVLARNEAEAVARDLAPLEVADADDWRATALVSLLRAVVVDLLQLTGLSIDQARAALGQHRVEDREEFISALPREEASTMWGTASFPAIVVPPPGQDDHDPGADSDKSHG